MVKIGEICRKCQYFGGQTQSCDYALVEHHSRTIVNGVQIKSGYCDKFVEGQRILDPNDWIKTEFKYRKAERIRKHGECKRECN